MDCYLCSVRKKSVLNQHKAICCDHCNQWVRIECNSLNDLDYSFVRYCMWGGGGGQIANFGEKNPQVHLIIIRE